MAKSGLRGFLAPGYASARWRLENDHELKYAWDEARGREGLAAALRVIDELVSRRLTAVLAGARLPGRSGRDAAP